MTECIFCSVVQKQAPAKIVFESEEIIAFHDIHKDAPQHVLIVPKKHIESLNTTEIADTNILGLMLQTVKEVTRQLAIDKSGYRCIINTNDDAGQIVKHLHLHVLGGKPLGRMIKKG